MKAKNRRTKELLKLISKEINTWDKEGQEAVIFLNDEIDKGTSIDKVINLLAKKYPDIFKLPSLQEALINAVIYGMGEELDNIKDGQKNNIKQYISKAWNENNLTLSEKLYGTNKKIRKKVAFTIKEQLKKNATILESARELFSGYGDGGIIPKQEIAEYMQKVRTATGFSFEAIKKQRQALYHINNLAQRGAPNRALKAAYNQLMQAVKDANVKAIKKAAYAAVMEKSRYVAERIIRTEAARAWGDGFFAETLADKNIVAYQWKLGSRHPVYDQCDFYANADLFNLGKGIYPKDKVPPYPAHPHCLCRIVEVFIGEVDMNREQNNIIKGGEEWLESISKDKQKALLGVQGAKEWAQGKSWEHFLKGWEGLKTPESRLTRDIIGDILKEEYLPKAIKIGNEFIPRYSVITNATLIAGKGHKTELRIAQTLATKYGGKKEDWQKMAGKITSDNYVFDIHWYKNDRIGKVLHKVSKDNPRKDKT